MSIIGAMAQNNAEARLWTALILYGATCGGIFLLVVSGAFRPRSINGPRRIEADEPLRPMLIIIGIGLFLWAMVPALVLISLRHGDLPKGYKPTPMEMGILSIVGGGVPLIFMLLGTVTRYRNGMEKLGLSWRHFKRAILPAVAGAIFAIPMVGWVALGEQWVLEKLQIFRPLKHELLEVMEVAPSRWVRVLIVIGAVVVAPLFEELLFRGYLQTLLWRLTRRRWLAVILASIGFALVHQHWVTWLPIFTLAVVLGYMYERTGKLWVPILIHAMFNATSIIASYYT